MFLAVSAAVNGLLQYQLINENFFLILVRHRAPSGGDAAGLVRFGCDGDQRRLRRPPKISLGQQNQPSNVPSLRRWRQRKIRQENLAKRQGEAAQWGRTRSRARGKVDDLMSQNDLVLPHSRLASGFDMGVHSPLIGNLGNFSR